MRGGVNRWDVEPALLHEPALEYLRPTVSVFHLPQPADAGLQHRQVFGAGW
jgi:hypothetical protein